MTKFLGNVKVTNYELIVANMIDKFKTPECLLSLKIHFFPKNLGDVNEEQRFHLTKKRIISEKKLQESLQRKGIGYNKK